jgi:hypothetical protein
VRGEKQKTQYDLRFKFPVVALPVSCFEDIYDEVLSATLDWNISSLFENKGLRRGCLCLFRG